MLDGRHHYLACQKVGIEPIVEQYRVKDPRAFVIRTNITRRHLTTEERGFGQESRQAHESLGVVGASCESQESR